MQTISSNYIKLLLLMFTILMMSCDIGDFGDMNVSPTSNPEMEPGMQFTYLQLQLPNSLRNANWHHGGPVIQAVTRANSAYNYYMHNQDHHEQLFNGHYGARLRNLTDLLHNLQARLDNGEPVENILAATRILKVYMYHRITDVYGDIPYFEAGNALYDLNFIPKYDPQEAIYLDMLNELSEAVAQISENGRTLGEQDLFYEGNIDQWRKFGNSLRLRLALRLIKVDPSKAQAEAVAAISAPGGVMSSNDDMAWFERPGPPHNAPNSEDQQDIGVWLITQTMVNWLKSHDDPRLRVYAAILDAEFVSDSGIALNHVVSTDPDDQLGYPSGYGNQESVTWGFSGFNIDQHPSWNLALERTPTPDVRMNGYSKLNPVMWTKHAPSIFMTYAEVALMRAEVAVRGWTSENAEFYYNEGVRSAMTFLSVYNNGSGSTITDSQANEYLSANPFDPNNAIKQINEQYWAAIFGSMDFMEGWANFRRSGYPDLEAAMVDSNEWPTSNSTGNTWPRRLLYPLSEQLQNADNLNEAQSRQNFQHASSDITIPVWWDID